MGRPLEQQTLPPEQQTLPLIAAAPEEVIGMFQRGEISEDQANEYYLKKRIADDFYEMLPEEIEEAYSRKLLNDADVSRYVDRKENPVWFFVKDTARGAVRGVQSGIEEMAQASNSIWNLIMPDVLEVAPEPKLPSIVEKPTTIPGQLVGGLTQAATGFIPAFGALGKLEKIEKFSQLAAKAPKAYEFVRGVVAGMIGDTVSFDPYDGRLSNMIEEHPSLRNPVTAFLKADPGDPEAEARLKNALEGALTGAAFDLVFMGLKGLKGKLWADKADVSDEVAKAVDDLLPPEQQKLSAKEKADALQEVTEAPEATEVAAKEEVILTTEQKVDLAQKYMKLMRGETDIDVKDLEKGGPFNLEKFDTIEDTYRSFQFFSDELIKIQKEMTGGKQTLFQMEMSGTKLNLRTMDKARGNLARYLGMSLDEIRKHYEGVKDGAARMLRDMEFLEGYSRFVSQYAKQAKTDAEKLQAVEHIYRLAEAQMLVKGIQTHTARSLASLQSIRRSRVPFSMLKDSDIMQLAAEYPGLDKVVREASKIADPEAMLKFANRTASAKFLDGVLEWRQAALLSSLGTHTVNILGTAAANILKGIEHSLGIGVQALAEGDIGRLRQIHYYGLGLANGIMDAIRVRGPRAQAKLVKEAVSEKGWFEGLHHGYSELAKSEDVGNFWKALLTGDSQLDFQTKFSHGPALPNWAAGPVVRLPFHLLTAEDEFFKNAMYRASLYSQAFDSARKLGKSGKDLDEYIRLFVGNPSDEAHHLALQEAREGTFSEALNPEGSLGKIQAGINRATWAKIMFIPFWKVGVNIARFATRRTPLGFMSSRFKEDMAAGGVRAAEAMMKIATGTALMGLASWMYSTGLITGTAPKGQEDAWRTAKIGENSIFINGKWIEYTRFEPLSLLFRIAADVTRIVENYNLPEEERDTIIDAGRMMIASLLSDSYMRGMKEFIDVFTDETFNFDRWVNRQIGTFFPFSAGVAQARREGQFGLDQDKTIRDVPSEFGIKQAWDSFIGTYDTDRLLPKRHNLYGTSLERDPRILHAFNQRIPDDPVATEMALIGMNVKAPSKSRIVSGATVKLDDKQYDEFMQTLSTLPVQETLTTVIKDPEYQAIKDRGARKKILQRVIESYREAAWKMYLEGNDELRNEFITKIEKQVRAALGLENNLAPTEQMKRLKEVMEDVR